MSEEGAAGVMAVALAAFVVALTLVVADIGSVLAAKAAASGAADAAALAAAPATFSGSAGAGAPRREASRYALLNGTRLVECSCELDSSWAARVVSVVVEVDVDTMLFGDHTLRVSGRAEFVPVLLPRGAGGNVSSPPSSSR